MCWQVAADRPRVRAGKRGRSGGLAVLPSRSVCVCGASSLPSCLNYPSRDLSSYRNAVVLEVLPCVMRAVAKHALVRVWHRNEMTQNEQASVVPRQSRHPLILLSDRHQGV